MKLNSRELYDTFSVTIKMRDKLHGGVPKNPDVLEDHIKRKTGYDDEQTKQQVTDAQEDLQEIVEESWNGFLCDEEKGLYIRALQVKAMLRECGSVLLFFKKKRGSKQIVQHGFEVKAPDGGDKLFLGRDKPDGHTEGPIHVMTPQGPRTALKRVDYVEGVTIKFEVWILKTSPQESRHLGEKDLLEMLKLAQENGLGADRSQGSGKLDVVEFAKTS